MSNVVGMGVALCIAVAWLILDTFSSVVQTHVEHGFRSLSRGFFEAERVESESCDTVDLLSLSKHRHVIERFVSVIEREVEWSSHHSAAHSVVSVFLDHAQLFVLNGSVFLCFACWCSC